MAAISVTAQQALDQLKELKLEDSNLANIGSDMDKEARKESAEGESAWQGAGQEPGVKVWRIEQFKVVHWPEDQYGHFHKGDSYIVMHTRKDPESDKLLWDIYFWLGEESTLDEMGTAAYKTVELDSLFDDAPVQHREVQGYESSAFHKLFKDIVYLEGGTHTGFNTYVEDAHHAELHMVRKHKGQWYCMQRPVSVRSLNQGDCFILDLGAKIICWHGSKASPFEKNRCQQDASRINKERHGKSKVVQYDSDEAIREEFWSTLGGKESDVQEACEEMLLHELLAEDAIGEGVLYKLTDEHDKLTLHEVNRGDLHYSMLESDAVFIVDSASDFFIWVGKDASDLETRQAWPTTLNVLRQNGKNNVPVTLYRETQGHPRTDNRAGRIWRKIMHDEEHDE